MPFRITEKFHLELGKLIEGSTISIGAEEKKVKINKNLDHLDVAQIRKEILISIDEPGILKRKATKTVVVQPQSTPNRRRNKV